MDSYTLYVLCILAFLASIIASIVVKTTFSKYNKVRSRTGKTAAQIAREILDANGLQHVQVVKQHGTLTDHYDPRSVVVALSEPVYASDSVGAYGIAAHEVGHAVQHAVGYTPIKVRTAIFPVVSITSRFWYILLIAGFIFEMMSLIYVAIGMYAFAVLFQLVTLPVELDASRRAMNTLSGKGSVSAGYLSADELRGAGKVLTAAAFTYIIALLMSILQLLRLLANARRR